MPSQTDLALASLVTLQRRYTPCDATDRIAFLKRASDGFFGLRHALTLPSDEIPSGSRCPDIQTPALTSASPDWNKRNKLRCFSFRKSQRKGKDANHLEERKERWLVTSILLALYMRRGHSSGLVA
jgi:hypothetical protein